MTPTVLAETMWVRRSDDKVALVLMVSPAELRELDPELPLAVMGLFSSHEHAARVQDAIGRAIIDAKEFEMTEKMLTEEHIRHKEMILKAIMSAGLGLVDSWDFSDDRIRAQLGRFRVLEDDEAAGLFEGTCGQLTSEVVGAAKYGNERAAFFFNEDGMDKDASIEVPDMMMLEPE